jgi:hypothetical protein
VDWSQSPEAPEPKAFGQRIRNAKFPECFRPPNTVTKYDGEVNPSVWLEDYRLTCRAAGPGDDYFIIQYLPIYLGDLARAWLEYLPVDSIHSWSDLTNIFVGKFQGTYKCPGNS